jgi:hypothetical protein
MLLRAPETSGSGTGKEDRLCEIQGISALTRSFSAQPAGIRLMTAGFELDWVVASLRFFGQRGRRVFGFVVEGLESSRGEDAERF